MTYKAELYGREDLDERPISSFSARIMPPIPGARELIEEYFDDEFFESLVVASTENATVIEVDMFGSDIASEEDPRFDECLRTGEFPHFRPHIERAELIAARINGLIFKLNAIDDPFNLGWKIGEQINLR